MRFRLPIPVFTETGRYTEVELVQPRGSVLADTERATREGNIFGGFQTILNGCITLFVEAEGREIDEPVSKKSLIMKMPLKSVEKVAIDALILHDPEIGLIEGVYTCPRCGVRIITEQVKSDDLDIDTRDNLDDMPVSYMEGDSFRFSVDFSEPVRIKESSMKSGETEIVEVASLTMDHPTLKDCFSTYARYGIVDPYRFQFGLFVEMIRGANGYAVDSKWKNKYGMMIFENIKNVKKDIGAITDEMEKYGRRKTIEKSCRACGKKWQAPMNTNRFFGLSPRTA